MERLTSPKFADSLEGRLRQFPGLRDAVKDVDPQMLEFLYSLAFMDGHSWGKYEAFVASGKTLGEYYGF